MHAVSDLVRELDRGVDEPCGDETLEVLTSGESAGDAPDVRAALGALVRAQVVLRDDVGDAEPFAAPAFVALARASSSISSVMSTP